MTTDLYQLVQYVQQYNSASLFIFYFISKEIPQVKVSNLQLENRVS